MIYLVPTSVTQAVTELCGRSDVGLMMTPAASKPRLLERAGCAWAADIGCWSRESAFDLGEYIRWLETMRPFNSDCLFATAPDVVGDALRTLDRSADVLPQIRRLGYLAALVAQDGLECCVIPWDAFDVLFVGGTTQWKLSDPAYVLAREAKDRGKWAHMGRVNTGRRFRAALTAGYDSVDGTCVAFGPDRNAPIIRRWLESQWTSPPLTNRA